jgi:hypothetical protein
MHLNKRRVYLSRKVLCSFEFLYSYSSSSFLSQHNTSKEMNFQKKIKKSSKSDFKAKQVDNNLKKNNDNKKKKIKKESKAKRGIKKNDRVLLKLSFFLFL